MARFPDVRLWPVAAGDYAIVIGIIVQSANGGFQETWTAATGQKQTVVINSNGMGLDVTEVLDAIFDD